MVLYKHFVGIDIGKFEFVAAQMDSKETHPFSNDIKGFLDFIHTYRSCLNQALIVLETTGGYENELLTYLIENGLVVHRADTRKVKNFIRSWGKYGKTDDIDAKALALYASERSGKLKPFALPQTLQTKIKNLVERRQDLTKMLVQEKNRAQAPLNKQFVESIQRHIQFLTSEITNVDSEILHEVNSSQEHLGRKKVLMTVPGVGEKTAHTLLANLPELGRLDRKQIASLCGVAPHPKQSGEKSWYRRTSGGRRDLRPSLFLAAMGAARSKTELGIFYQSLIKRGKKPIVALTAVMRKIVVIANARLRDNLLSSSAINEMLL